MANLKVNNIFGLKNGTVQDVTSYEWTRLYHHTAEFSYDIIFF